MEEYLTDELMNEIEAYMENDNSPSELVDALYDLFCKCSSDEDIIKFYYGGVGK